MEEFELIIKAKVDQALAGIRKVEQALAAAGKNANIDVSVGNINGGQIKKAIDDIRSRAADGRREIGALQQSITNLGQAAQAFGVGGVAAGLGILAREAGTALSALENLKSIGRIPVEIDLGPIRAVGEAVANATGFMQPLIDLIQTLGPSGIAAGAGIGVATTALLAFSPQIERAVADSQLLGTKLKQLLLTTKDAGTAFNFDDVFKKLLSESSLTTLTEEVRRLKGELNDTKIYGKAVGEGLVNGSRSALAVINDLIIAQQAYNKELAAQQRLMQSVKDDRNRSNGVNTAGEINARRANLRNSDTGAFGESMRLQDEIRDKGSRKLYSDQNNFGRVSNTPYNKYTAPIALLPAFNDSRNLARLQPKDVLESAAARVRQNPPTAGGNARALKEIEGLQDAVKKLARSYEDVARQKEVVRKQKIDDLSGRTGFQSRIQNAQPRATAAFGEEGAASVLLNINKAAVGFETRRKDVAQLRLKLVETEIAYKERLNRLEANGIGSSNNEVTVQKRLEGLQFNASTLRDNVTKAALPGSLDGNKDLFNRKALLRDITEAENLLQTGQLSKADLLLARTKQRLDLLQRAAKGDTINGPSSNITGKGAFGSPLETQQRQKTKEDLRYRSQIADFNIKAAFGGTGVDIEAAKKAKLNDLAKISTEIALGNNKVAEAKLKFLEREIGLQLKVNQANNALNAGELGDIRKQKSKGSLETRSDLLTRAVNKNFAGEDDRVKKGELLNKIEQARLSIMEDQLALGDLQLSQVTNELVLKKDLNSLKPPTKQSLDSLAGNIDILQQGNAANIEAVGNSPVKYQLQASQNTLLLAEKNLLEAIGKLNSGQIKQGQEQLAIAREKFNTAKLESQLAAREVKEASDKKKSRGRAVQDVLIGGGFPLLFGQGPGAALGGGIGGGAGGLLSQGAGFAGSIVGSVIGTAVDKLVASLTDLGSALKDPTKAIEAMRTAGLYVSGALEFNVKELNAAGRAYEAQALVFREVERQLGAGSGQQLNALYEEQERLKEKWSEVSLVIAKGVLPILVGVIQIITDSIDPIVALGKAWGDFIDGPLGFLPPFSAAKGTRAIASGIAAKGKERISKSAVKLNLPALSRDQGKIDRDAAEDQADKIKAAYREGFQLNQQAIDLERAQLDLRRRVETDIFNLRQENTKKEIDQARQKADIQIKAAETAAKRAVGSETGLAEQLLNGVIQYISVKKQGEADIKAREKTAVIELEQLKKRQVDYAIDIERSIDGIVRQRISLEFALEDFKLKNSRDIRAQNELSMAAGGQEVKFGRPATNSGRGGLDLRRGDMVSGFPVTSGYGPRKFPGGIGSTDHGGVDVGAPEGTPVSYSMGGKVLSAKWDGGYGKGLLVQLENGVKSYVGHLSKFEVAVGATFKAGQMLARIGSTGNSTGSHGHFGATGYGDSNSGGIPYVRLGGNRAQIEPNARASSGSKPDVLGRIPAFGSRSMASRDGGAAAIPVRSVGPVPLAGTGGVRTAAVPGSASSQAAVRNLESAAIQARYAAPGGPSQSQLAQKARLEGQAQGLVKKDVAIAKDKVRADLDEARLALEKLAAGDSSLRQTQYELDLKKEQLGLAAQAGTLSDQEFERQSKLLENQSALNVLAGERKAFLEGLPAVAEALKLNDEQQAALAALINTQLDERVKTQTKLNELGKQGLEVDTARANVKQLGDLQKEYQTKYSGVRAGYTGPAADTYDSAIMAGADKAQAKAAADLKQAITRVDEAYADAQAMSGAIGQGLSSALKAAITGGDVGQAFSTMFGQLGDKFIERAFRPIDDLLTKTLFGILDPSGGLGLGGAKEALAGAQAQITASTLSTAAIALAPAGPALVGAAGSLYGAAAAISSMAGVGSAGNFAGSIFGGFGGGGGGFGIGGSAFDAFSGGGFLGGGGGIGGILSGILGFAEGGNPPTNEPYIVGENGPELRFDRTPGTILSNKDTRAYLNNQGSRPAASRSKGAGSTGVIDVKMETVVINNVEYATMEQVRKSNRQAVAEAQARTADSMRRSGAFRQRAGL